MGKQFIKNQMFAATPRGGAVTVSSSFNEVTGVSTAVEGGAECGVAVARVDGRCGRDGGGNRSCDGWAEDGEWDFQHDADDDAFERDD